MKKWWLLAAVVNLPIGLYLHSKRKSPPTVPWAATASFEDYCTSKGYQVSSHTVSTEDGYQLKLFRLSSPSIHSSKSPVLLVHGLTHSAISFAISQTSTAPAFQLVQNGFDVWLLNTRGNYLSRSHATLSPMSQQFWQWCSNQIGYYDIPASIDYITENTKKKKINYIGHSQGGFVGMFTLAVRPEYSEKVNVLAVLAAPGGGKISAKAEYLNVAMSEEFLSEVEKNGVYVVGDWSDKVGAPALEAINDFENAAVKYKDKYNVKLEGEGPEVLAVYLQQFAGGTSTMNLRYLGQIVKRNSKEPFMYDFGEAENLVRYGQATPPMIDYSKIKSKIALFYGKHDNLCTMADGENLISLLPAENIVFKKLDYNVDHAGFAVSPNQAHVHDIIAIFNQNEPINPN